MGRFARRISRHFHNGDSLCDILGPAVQNVVSLTSSLVVEMLTVLVSTISNSQLFLLKNVKCKRYSHFFSKNNSVYAIFNDQSFNDTLTNVIVSFEQLGPVCFPEQQPHPSEKEATQERTGSLCEQMLSL